LYPAFFKLLIFFHRALGGFFGKFFVSGELIFSPIILLASYVRSSLKMTENFYYFDTSIWIDLYDKRGYNGEMALKLMEKIINNDDFVVYSDVIVFELKKLGFSEYEINQMLAIAKPDHIKRVHSTANQLKEAAKLAKQRKVPLRDAAHAVLSRDHQAQLVSLDWDFEQLKDITKTKKPEDLL